MVKILNRLALAGVFVAFQPAVAQESAPAGQTASAAEVNSNAPIVKSINMRLPLKPNESLVEFENGCALISDNDNPVNMRGWSWYGACPFGVANGEGVLEQEDGKRIINTYYYGLAVRDKLVFGDYYSYHNNYDSLYPIYIVAKPVVSSVIIAEIGKGLWFVSLDEKGGSGSKVYFGNGTFSCPFKSLSESVPILESEYKSEARSACSLAARQNRNLSTPIQMRYLAEHRYKMKGLNDLPSTPKEPNPVIARIKICPVIAGGTDCIGPLIEMMAPYREKIDAVIAGNHAALAATTASFTARFKPLEDALAEKARRLAPRLRLRDEADGDAPLSPETAQTSPASAK